MAIDLRSRAARATVAVALVVLVTLAYWKFGGRRAPQIGADEQVATAVDALFTAFTSRDAKRLAQTEQQLRAMKESGRLPAAAATDLEGFIGLAHAGSWRPAAEKLYLFMRQQRR